MIPIHLLKKASAVGVGHNIGRAIKAVGRGAGKAVSTSANLGEGLVTSLGGNATVGRVLGVGALAAGTAAGVRAGKDKFELAQARRRMMRGGY